MGFRVHKHKLLRQRQSSASSNILPFQCHPLTIISNQPLIAMGQGHGGIKREIEGADRSPDEFVPMPVTLLPVCGNGVHLDVVLYGDNVCGKTCLAIRYERNTFGPTTATIGEATCT